MAHALPCTHCTISSGHTFQGMVLIQFGNTLFNLLFTFGSDSHSHCHSSCIIEKDDLFHCLYFMYLHVQLSSANA